MERIKDLLEQIYNENNIAGMSVAITDNKKIVSVYNFGVESIERPQISVSELSLYRIASITKVVTGITLMKLVEQGILDIDIPVKNYLPWLKFKNGEENKITVRHLLSHTSGLPKEYTPDGYREESALEKSLKEGLPTLEFASKPEEEKYLYSNWGIRLASCIAETITGEKFSVLAKKLVLSPLKMDYTTFDLRVAMTYPLSLPHVEENGRLKVRHYMNENAARLAAGGLFSNTTDLCKLARFILNDGVSDDGERVVKGETLTEMHLPHAQTDRGDFYGLTTLLHKHNGRISIGHLGSASPYATALAVDKKSGLGIALLMNTERNNLRTEIPDKIFDLING